MENQQSQRLIYDTECKDCSHKAVCKWADTQQCCRGITNKLRTELRNNKKQRKIVAKISIPAEYVYNNHRPVKTIAKEGTFVLQEPYRFGKPFLRAEIIGEGGGGTFSTEYYNWK